MITESTLLSNKLSGSEADKLLYSNIPELKEEMLRSN